MSNIVKPESAFFGDHKPAFDNTLPIDGGVMLRGVPKRGNTIVYFPAFSYTLAAGVLTITNEDPSKATEPYKSFTVRVSDHQGGEAGGTIKDGDPFTVDVSKLQTNCKWTFGFGTSKQDVNKIESYFNFAIRNLDPALASGGYDTGDALVRSKVSVDGVVKLDSDTIAFTGNAAGSDYTATIDVENLGNINDLNYTVELQEIEGDMTTAQTTPLIVAPGATGQFTVVLDGQTTGEYFGILKLISADKGVFSVALKWTIS